MTKTRTGAQYLLVVAAAVATRQLVHARQQRRRSLGTGGGRDVWTQAVTGTGTGTGTVTGGGPGTP